MERFEAGVSYYTMGGRKVTVTKRTAHYITFTGDYSGRALVRELKPFEGTESCIIGSNNWDKRFLIATDRA